MKHNSRKKYIIGVCFLILLYLHLPAHSQDKVEYGTTDIVGKKLTVEDKYVCTIAPTFVINKDNPDRIKLFFTVDWSYKNNVKITNFDKVTLFVKVNDSFNDYCNTNNKKLSVKPRLYNENSELSNSIEFLPTGIMEINPYRTIILGNDSPPINISVSKYVDSPIKFNLLLYTGKEKKSSVLIENKLDLLSWDIILPPEMIIINETKIIEKEKPVVDITEEGKPIGDTKEKEITATSSCEELESHYNQQYKKNQPQFTIGYYESKLLEIESGLIPKENLHELKSSLYEFKSNVIMLAALKKTIRNNPKYNDCVDLPSIVGNINNYITDPTKIENIIGKIKQAIVNQAGEGGAGGAVPPHQAFDDNLEFFQTTFDKLSDIKINPNLRSNYDKSYYNELYKQVISKKSSLDSLFTIIENPSNTKKYKLANANYNASLGIIEQLSPESKDRIESGSGQESEEQPKPSPKKRSFPWTWIIIPLVALLAGFGLYKYMGKIKKAKSISKKV